ESCDCDEREPADTTTQRGNLQRLRAAGSVLARRSPFGVSCPASSALREECLRRPKNDKPQDQKRDRRELRPYGDSGGAPCEHRIPPPTTIKPTLESIQRQQHGRRRGHI